MTARRRDRGTGLLRKRTDGRWEGRYRATDGRMRSVFARTKREASDKLTDALQDTRDGIAPVNARTTLGQYLDTWLDRWVAPERAPRTTESYTYIVTRYLKPRLGAVPLIRLSPDHIQSMLNDLAAEGELSATTRRYIYSVLRIALERARKSRSIRENVATLADPPAKSTTSVEPWSRDEAGRFLEAVEGDRLEALYNLAMLVGLRQSELLGLTWRDLDLEGRRIRVRHQLQRGTLELVDLKTDESQRDLDLPARVADLLVEHRLRQQVIRLDGPVFVSSAGGPIEHRNLAHAFDRRVAEAGVRRINFHALRHCAASYQLDQGATIDEVKMMLGHTQRSTTVELYSHLLDRGRRAVADRADAMFPRKTARG